MRELRPYMWHGVDCAYDTLGLFGSGCIQPRGVYQSWGVVTGTRGRWMAHRPPTRFHHPS